MTDVAHGASWGVQTVCDRAKRSRGAIAQGEALGIPLLSRGIRADETGFAYFDTRTKAGTVLEVRKTQN